MAQNTTRMKPATAAADPTRCPLCGGANSCAMEQARASGQVAADCWCTRTRIAPAVLAQVPEAARGLACICPACAAQAALPARTSPPPG